MHPFIRPALVALFAGAAASPSPQITLQQSGTTQRLQAVSPVDDHVVWASGTGGTYVVTTDGGDHWRPGQVPGADSLEFRDVQGLDSLSAWLLAAGTGAKSRIYHTGDGGRTWTLQFTNTDSLAFYDCFGFWDATHGIAVSDAVLGRFPILVTDDGVHWRVLPPESRPAADSGEGAFAASGTCLMTAGANRVWIGTGASAVGGGRVLTSDDRGGSWRSAVTPIQHNSASAGITSLAFRDAAHGYAAGGDINPRDSQTTRVARTSDYGRTWHALIGPSFPGPVYGGAIVPGMPRAFVTVGPGGAAATMDEGTTWVALDSAGYWSVAFASARAGWMVGPGGRIAKISLP
jgi:photosystem II stability/assembly factor-like uncharacterized protein